MNGSDRSSHAGDQSDRWGFARLVRRAEFQRAAKGERRNTRCLALQGVLRPDADAAPGPRFGLTITKKVGCAVVRNRIRRRLRAAIKSSPDLDARPTHDYVIVARREALHADFQALRGELARAIRTIHEPRTRDTRRLGSSANKPDATSGAATR